MTPPKLLAYLNCLYVFSLPGIPLVQSGDCLYKNSKQQQPKGPMRWVGKISSGWLTKETFQSVLRDKS